MKKFIYTLIFLFLNFFYINLKNLYKKVKKWYLPMKEEDKIIWFAFAPFYWLLASLVSLTGYPSEKLKKIIES